LRCHDVTTCAPGPAFLPFIQEECPGARGSPGSPPNYRLTWARPIGMVPAVNGNLNLLLSNALLLSGAAVGF